MNCQTVDCANPQHAHVYVRAGCCAGPVVLCRSCLTFALKGHATCHGNRVAHIADHPIVPVCRHPESRWCGDRCVIDGLELLENVDALEGVPA